MYNKSVERRTISKIEQRLQVKEKIEAILNCLTITCIVSKLCPLFMRVPRGDRRNGDSPRQGIDTYIEIMLLATDQKP